MAFSDDLTYDLANTWLGASSEWADTVTYRVAPGDSSLSASTSSVAAIPEADLKLVEHRSPRNNMQFMTWYVNSADVSAPKRGDSLTDSNSVVWHVADVTGPYEYDGWYRLSTKAGQAL